MNIVLVCIQVLFPANFLCIQFYFHPLFMQFMFCVMQLDNNLFFKVPSIDVHRRVLHANLPSARPDTEILHLPSFDLPGVSEHLDNSSCCHSYLGRCAHKTGGRTSEEMCSYDYVISQTKYHHTVRFENIYWIDWIE